MNLLLKRREVICFLPAAAAVGPRTVSAEPMTLALVMMPLIVQVVADFFRARRDEEMALRISRAELHNQFTQSALAAGNIQAAMLARRLALAELGQLSPDIDSGGTRMGVGRGMVWVDGRHGAGFLTPDEAELAAAMMAQGQACPVPESPTYHPIDAGYAPKMLESLAEANRSSPREFLASHTPLQWRPISIGGSRGSAVITATNQMVGTRRATRTFLV